MEKPVLVVMAAGMGSRFGGLKQIQPVDNEGHAIIDFSLFDARRAGFEKVIFIIKHEIEEEFKASVGKRMEQYFDVEYVYQEIDKIPQGFDIPSERVKPWGTGHAILCCKEIINGPFAVINSDDYYGMTAYSTIYDFLKVEREPSEYAMVGYQLKNTVTENGYVARGICDIKDGYLSKVVERTHIEKDGDNAAFLDEDGVSKHFLDGNIIVSMNLWGFQRSFIDALDNGFSSFLDDAIKNNPLKGEYFLPSVANQLLSDNECSVKMLECNESWYGVTYKEDLDSVKQAVCSLKDKGIYPRLLWEGKEN